MAKRENVLDMQGSLKVFPGVRALDGVNLKVRAGKVHVICGENGAGKSTLMKTINGTYVADEGKMFYKGAEIGKHTVQDTIKMGIAMIYQELNPVLDMSIAENIYLGREPMKGMFVDYGKLFSDTQSLLDRLDIPYNAHQKMKELSIAGHQLIEIAKAISMNASVIIMDEPSSAIGDEEIEVLFKQIFALREQGVAILYITHKMDEIFRIADEITIIRDGKWIESGPASDYDPNKLVARMVGREITNVFPKDLEVPIGDVVLEALPGWSAPGAARSCARFLALTRSPPAKFTSMGKRSTSAAQATRSKQALQWSTRTARATGLSLSGISTKISRWST